jgi:4-azaleucine resistance transporter AzlC
MEPSPIMTDSSVVRGSFKAGARAVLPIAIAAAAFGVSFGILARDAGMGVVAPLAFSVTTFAGSAQFAAASVLESGGALATAIVSAILLNLRYVALGVSVAPSLRGSLPRRLAEAQLTVDESWAVAQDRGRVDRGRLLGAGLLLMVAWTGGTLAGVLGGEAIGDPESYGLDAMFPALFLALLAGLVPDRRARLAALTGGAVSLILLPAAPAGVPVIAAIAGAALGLRGRR